MIDLLQKLNELGLLAKRLTGRKHQRCGTVTHPKSTNGWFIVNDESVSYGSWDGSVESGYFWLNDSKPLTAEEKQAYAKRRAEQEIKQRELEQKDRIERLESVRGAYALTKRRNPHHAYVSRKQIDFRLDFTHDMQGRLVIPMVNIQNQLMGYQYINDVGEKKFKSGSITKESFYCFKPYDISIAELDLIFICEGVATAGSVYQALNQSLDAVNYGVVATFSAGNIKPVIDSLHRNIGGKSMVGIADNDIAGINAYNHTGVKFMVVGIANGDDANDVHIQFGSDALAELILNFLQNK